MAVGFVVEEKHASKVRSKGDPGIVVATNKKKNQTIMGNATKIM